MPALLPAGPAPVQLHVCSAAQESVLPGLSETSLPEELRCMGSPALQYPSLATVLGRSLSGWLAGCSFAFVPGKPSPASTCSKETVFSMHGQPG